MAKLYMMNAVAFDFTKTKVRVLRKPNGGGKWNVMDKTDICYHLQRLDFRRYMFAEEIMKYAECKEALLKELTKRNFDDIKIIK